jgi:hypothetical protein
MRNAAAAVVDYVTNGDFSSSAGWTLGSGWSISGGTANASSAIAPLSTTAAITLVPGTYRFAFEIKSYSYGQLIPFIAGVSGTFVSAVGVFSQDIVVGSVSNQLVELAPTGFAGVVDNVSVTKIA